MGGGRAARTWHGLTAAVALVALVWQLVLVFQGSAVLDETSVPAMPEQVRRYFFYFTIQSNLLVAWTSFLVATRDIAGSRGLRVLRLDAVLGITITGVVHFVLLRPLLDLDGASYVVDKLLHVVVPLVAVLGWVAFGPRGLASRADVPLALVWPVVWLVVILATGPVFDWYPYPFVDVAEHGLGVVLLNCLGVTVLFLAVAFGLAWADSRLPGRKPGDRAVRST